MSSLRQVLASLCLTSMVSASMPSWAESGEASPGTDGGAAASALAKPALAPLDLNAVTLGTTMPFKAGMQQTAETAPTRKMSGKKKAWIIIGSVLGAVAIAAAVGHHGGGGSGSSGGGGY